MSSDIVIRVENLSKCYQIYDQPRDRLKQFILPRLQRTFGQACKQYYREFWALKDVSFEVKRGETVGIIGRNGSGKSTLLQIICGTLNPSSGTIHTSGRIAALLELGSGFNPEFTGRENVYMNAAVLGLSQDEIDARIDEITAFADIGEFIDRPVKTYSSGMFVRLAFAVQVAVEPAILVVDEALAVGDEIFQRKCFARLEELKRKGTSILFVSHSPSSIVELCEKTLLLDSGSRLMYTSAANAVRAYQKMIYAPVTEQDDLFKSYQLLDSVGVGGDSIDFESVDEDSPCDRGADDYDPGLVPETTMTYPVQGAEIRCVRILNPDGVRVNVLRTKEEYQFEVSGSFLDELDGVYFGVHVRNVSGVVITGQRYPEEGVFIRDVEAGKSFKLVFSFSVSLLPGVYFVGAGVWTNREPNCAHRILDAAMFRVIPQIKSLSFGYVDLSSREPGYELF